MNTRGLIERVMLAAYGVGAIVALVVYTPLCLVLGFMSGLVMPFGLFVADLRAAFNDGKRLLP